MVASLFAAGPSSAHVSDECFVHVTEAHELAKKYKKALDETVHLLDTYEAESREVFANLTMDSAAASLSRFMFVQVPTAFERLTSNQRMSIRIATAAMAAVRCVQNEPKPITTAAPAVPIELEWLDEVMAGLDEPSEPEAPPEPPQERVFLGVNCTKPLTISLPGDVLTECETE